jgi:hypothetical protein
MRSAASSAITFSFAVLFGLVVVVARAIAVAAPGPWFTPTTSTHAYTAGVAISTVATLSTVYVAAQRAAYAGRASFLETSRHPAVGPPRSGPGPDARPDAGPRVLHGPARRVWSTVGGPIAVAFSLGAISAAMLPGAEGFATANFRLNATFVLILAYGWWIVLLWLIVAVMALPSPTSRPGVSREAHEAE